MTRTRFTGWVRGVQLGVNVRVDKESGVGLVIRESLEREET